MYDKEPGYDGKHKQPRKKSLKSIAAIYDYYITRTFNPVINKDGDLTLEFVSEDDVLEKSFGNTEKNAFELIDALPSTSKGLMKISAEQRALLSTFTALSYVRTPSFLEGLVGPFRKAAEAQHQRELTDDSFRQFLASTDPNALINFVPQIAANIANKRWIFWTPYTGMSFVTSDTPVHHKWRNNPPHQGIDAPWNPEQEVYFPLRRDLALTCLPGAEVQNAIPINNLNQRQTKDFRRNIALTARRFVFADFASHKFAEMVFKRRKYTQEFFTASD